MCDFDLGKDFLDTTQEAQFKTKKKQKLDGTKLKTSVL